MTPSLDEDALTAAVDLIGRTGARQFEAYFPDPDDGDEPPYVYTASAIYQGARVMEESTAGPVEAAEGLARRLLEGAKCAHCNKLVTLSDAGVYVVPGATLIDGTVLPTDPEELRAMGSCRWRRMGPKWIRGCEPDVSTRASRPSRADRRAHKRRRGGR